MTLTISADGRTLAAVQSTTTRNVYILPGDGSQSIRLRPLALQLRDIRYLNWTADGKLLASDGTRLWKIGIDGKNPIRLLSDPEATLFTPSACRDGSIVFPWAFHGRTNSLNIWRVNADGSNPLKLTSGQSDHNALCAPDQKWAYYFDEALGQIWRVSSDGSGKPEAVQGSNDFHGFILYPDKSISADGKTLTYTVKTIDTRSNQSTVRIALLSLESPKLLLIEPNPHIIGGVQFTPDEKAIAYPVRENGVDNLWVQPLYGYSGHQITKFNSGQIYSFHWSPDGKNLGVVRGHTESDVVLLQESNQ